MIYVTGDLHGDLARFKSKAFRKLKRKDTLIVCGDFGFIWNGSKKEEAVLKWIGRRKYNVLFVDGVHDNMNLIKNYENSEWKSGQTKKISGRLRYLCRGEIFQIEDKNIFAFGGGEDLQASKDDTAFRWWELQLPAPAQLENAENNLDRADWKVDYIVTHQCSRQTKRLLTMEDDEANVLDTFFNKVRSDCEYRGWFFGSYHIDKILPPKEMAIFQKVIPLQETLRKSIQK